jgi:hypothetical protein
MTLTGTDGGEWGDGFLTSNGAAGFNSRIAGLTITDLLSLDTIGEGQLAISFWLAMDDWNDVVADSSVMSYGVCNTAGPGFNIYINSSRKLIINTSGDGGGGAQSAVRNLFPLGYAGGYQEVAVTVFFSKNEDDQIVVRSFVDGYAHADMTNTSGTAWTASSNNIDKGLNFMSKRSGTDVIFAICPDGFKMKNVVIGRTNANQQRSVSLLAFDQYQSAKGILPRRWEEVLA